MRSIAAAASIAFALALAGCGTRELARSEAHIQPQVTHAALIPQPVRAVPLPPAPSAHPAEIRYSVVVVNQPVREVLLAMARETKVNFDIAPGIEGTVTINAVDQTLKQILTRMAKQVDMRWEEQAGTISVMPDTPYLRNYHVDYVNMARDVTETVGIATQVISQGAVGTTAAGGTSYSGTGAGNNSLLNITGTSKNRFWETLEKNIKDLLRETDKLLPEGSSETYVQNRGQSSVATSQSRTTTSPRTGRTTTSRTGTTVENPGETASAQQGDYVEQRLTFREAASVIVNPETGIVSVRATSRQHEKVQEFLASVSGAAKRQVVIEATVVEVLLNDNYQAGVDWSALGLQGLGYSFQQSLIADNLSAPPFFSVTYNNPNAAVGGSIKTTVKMLDTFGKTRVLSSPTLMVMNNQTAVLKVVDNRVYFTVKADTNLNANTSVTTFTTTQNVVPVGFIMNVTPQISDGDMVTLNVRPTVTRIIGYVNDPNPSLAQVHVVSQIPETQTREMESVLKVGSGQTAILGGLMLDSFEGHRDGIPIASRVPILGDLVSYRNDTAQKSELVIFIRPIVVHDASIEGDLAGYRRYLPDRDFFKDTRAPLPNLQEKLDRIENSELRDLDAKAPPTPPEAPK